MPKIESFQVVFLIGSPRSGTTILENILECHPQIAGWYEPYYLWEKYFPAQKDDVWLQEDIPNSVTNKIHQAFHLYSRKSGKRIVLDKLPTHAFNLPVLNAVFPDAKYIHIIRDGRDVTLSINKEWNKRRRMVENRLFLELFSTAFNMLKRQPYWRFRIMAVFHEVSIAASMNPLKYLNKSRWKGKIGWGPRFRGWYKYLDTHTPLQFNAMQWATSLEAILAYWPNLSHKNKVEIRYEDLLQYPEESILRLLRLLDIDQSMAYFSILSALRVQNYGKWKKEFKPEEIKEIKPILESLIMKLGYDNPSQW
jgi:hypothetical protein